MHITTRTAPAAKRIRCALISGLAVTAVSLATLGATAPAAHAEYDIDLKSGKGTVLRAVFYEHANGGGSAITYKGGSSCTKATSNKDYSSSSMPAKWGNSWNDSVSSWNDYNGCDVRFFADINFKGDHTGWLNGGTGDARNMPAYKNGINWNDIVSSFQVS